MAVSDSMFLFDITVSDLKCFLDCNECNIRLQFADLFTLNFRDPNKLDNLRKRSKIKPITRKQKVRGGTEITSKHAIAEPRPETSQSILFLSEVIELIENMRKYPMELSIYTKNLPDFKFGSSFLKWNNVFLDYLNKLLKNQDPQPVVHVQEHNVFDEYTSKCMASVKLSVKLTRIKKPITTGLTEQSLNVNNEVESDKIVEEKPDDNPGIIKTIYSGPHGKYQIGPRALKHKILRKKHNLPHMVKKNKHDKPIGSIKPSSIKQSNTKKLHFRRSILSFIKSFANLDQANNMPLLKKSYSIVDVKQRQNMLNYIFGNPDGPFGNNVYYVGYMTVQDAPSKPSDPSNPSSTDTNQNAKSYAESSPGGLSRTPSPVLVLHKSRSATDTKPKYSFRICDPECPSTKVKEYNEKNIVTLDLPQEQAHRINITKCKMVECDHKKFLQPLPPPDDRFMFDLTSVAKKCCVPETIHKIEEVVGAVKAKIIGGDERSSCFCACDCTFGFVKKTTYCRVCGGYEIAGEEIIHQDVKDVEKFPCPIFHKLVDKKKLQAMIPGLDKKKPINTLGTVGSGVAAAATSATATVTSSADKVNKPDKAEKRLVEKLEKRGGSDKKSIESEKDSTKKSKKCKNSERFKFNYGYQGIPPQIGHSQCAMPCTGTLGPVPKGMGWLWTADNIPGLKFRPNWRPGATNKHVVRLLRMARNPETVPGKRRKKDAGKKKKPLKRPLLVVAKKEGEYTVTMETQKQYIKQRAVNQHPYEDKPLITYTIGRTEEENRLRHKKKERARRRCEREQREFIQNTFRDMCEEICMKTYRQAMGLLPHSEDPECPCYPALPASGETEHSCSCTDSLSSFGSDTDSDQWVIEFTPPNAFFDPAYKGKKITKSDMTTQYSYLDYKVKLLDRLGNPIPRYFKGPDGTEQCSDLGGFWGPGHVWLDINVDGFIESDGRWAPTTFTGPDGDQVYTDAGKFQTNTGEWLVIGVDGYVDANNKWRYYSKAKELQPKKKRTSKKGGAGDKKDIKDRRPSEATFSCFGDASPKLVSKLGIVGHGHDRKMLVSKLEEMKAHGENVKIPQPSQVPTSGRKITKKDVRRPAEKITCKHPVPSNKGIIAVDGQGRKTYFRLSDSKNNRAEDRMVALAKGGISLSSFHVPCLSSFISSEVMRQQQYEHILEHNARTKEGAAQT